MHLRFNDAAQPGIAEYLKKTPDTTIDEWEDPVEEKEDDDLEIICDSPAPKRIKN